MDPIAVQSYLYSWRQLTGSLHSNLQQRKQEAFYRNFTLKNDWPHHTRSKQNNLNHKSFKKDYQRRPETKAGSIKATATIDRNIRKYHYKISKKVTWAPSPTNRHYNHAKDLNAKSGCVISHITWSSHHKPLKSWIIIHKKSRSRTNIKRLSIDQPAASSENPQKQQKVKKTGGSSTQISNRDSTPSINSGHKRFSAYQPDRKSVV